MVPHTPPPYLLYQYETYVDNYSDFDTAIIMEITGYL